MQQSKLDRINGLWESLCYQFPRWPTTYSRCRQCNKSDARGHGPCLDCSTEALGKEIGQKEALKIKQQMVTLQKSWNVLCDNYSMSREDDG